MFASRPLVLSRRSGVCQLTLFARRYPNFDPQCPLDPANEWRVERKRKTRVKSKIASVRSVMATKQPKSEREADARRKDEGRMEEGRAGTKEGEAREGKGKGSSRSSPALAVRGSWPGLGWHSEEPQTGEKLAFISRIPVVSPAGQPTRSRSTCTPGASRVGSPVPD